MSLHGQAKDTNIFTKGGCSSQSDGYSSKWLTGKSLHANPPPLPPPKRTVRPPVLPWKSSCGENAAANILTLSAESNPAKEARDLPSDVGLPSSRETHQHNAQVGQDGRGTVRH
jgi:hypothetical protein